MGKRAVATTRIGDWVRDLHTCTGLEVSVLGRLCVLVDGRETKVPGSVGRLIAFLALDGPSVGRDRTAGSLWPDIEDSCSLQRLRSALWKTSSIVPGLLMADSETVGFAEGVSIDLAIAKAWASSLWEGTTRAESVPVSLFSHDVLIDSYEPWIAEARQSFSETRVRVLEAVARERLEAGHPAAAIEPCLLAILSDPFRESPRRLLAEINVAEGNPATALTQISQYRAMLFEELGTVPSRQMADLEKLILSAG